VAGLHGDVNLETSKAWDEYFQFPGETVSEHDGRVPKTEGSSELEIDVDCHASSTPIDYTRTSCRPCK
jgi:hypothetical protein